MRELSVAGSILQLVEGSARKEAFQRVRSLRLSVPALAGVEVAALRFALEALARGSLLEGARVDIDEPPGQARCTDCGLLSRSPGQRGVRSCLLPPADQPPHG